MANLVETFKELIEAEDTSESNVQDFLEQNSELIHTPFLLHHYLHHNFLISKFPLDTAIRTDFAYITMHSGFSYVVLMELEHPKRRLFTNKPKQVTQSAELTSALSQIQSWGEFLRQNQDEVIRRLLPLIGRVVASRPISFKYVLVIGRSHEIENQQGRKARLATLNTDERSILTYDSLINAFNKGPKFKKNILALTKDKYRFKYLNEPGAIFAYLSPENLELTAEQKRFLLERGYEVDEWEKGKLLTLGGKELWR